MIILVRKKPKQQGLSNESQLQRFPDWSQTQSAPQLQKSEHLAPFKLRQWVLKIKQQVEQNIYTFWDHWGLLNLFSIPQYRTTVEKCYYFQYRTFIRLCVSNCNSCLMRNIPRFLITAFISWKRHAWNIWFHKIKIDRKQISRNSASYPKSSEICSKVKHYLTRKQELWRNSDAKSMLL